jgi:hypothetical protein
MKRTYHVYPHDTAVFHRNGKISYRIKGKWTRRARHFTPEAFHAMPHRIKEEVIFREYETGRTLVKGVRVLVSCKKHQPISFKAWKPMVDTESDMTYIVSYET